MDRNVCNNMVIQRLTNGSLSPSDPIFYREGQDILSDPKNIGLTLPGCQQTCGRRFNFYDDIGPRLTTWLIPVIILIGNMSFAPLGQIFSSLTIIHLLGDPIDSIWSLLTKLEVYSRAYSLAERHARQYKGNAFHKDDEKSHIIRDQATILATIEELHGASGHLEEQFQTFLSSAQAGYGTFDLACSDAASELADSRANEIPRALLAILGYVFTVIGAFVEAVGGQSSSQPGGRIGFAMLFAWLIVAVLLSAIVGGFTSRRTCRRILDRFARNIASSAQSGSTPYVYAETGVSSMVGRTTVTTDGFQDAQPWAGAIYTYRPNKSLFTGGARDRHPLFLLLLSTLPVVLSTVAAFVIIWYTPTVGMNCRHIALLAILTAWMLSVFLTWSTRKVGLLTGKYHFYFTIAKDAIIAIPLILLVVLINCGLFNSCWCWSAVYSRGRNRALILLDPNDERQVNAKSIYPGMVGANLGLQFALFLWMLFADRKGGSLLLRRNESVRQEDFERVNHIRRVSVVEGMGVGVPLLSNIAK